VLSECGAPAGRRRARSHPYRIDSDSACREYHNAVRAGDRDASAAVREDRRGSRRRGRPGGSVWSRSHRANRGGVTSSEDSPIRSSV